MWQRRFDKCRTSGLPTPAHVGNCPNSCPALRLNSRTNPYSKEEHLSCLDEHFLQHSNLRNRLSVDKERMISCGLSMICRDVWESPPASWSRESTPSSLGSPLASQPQTGCEPLPSCQRAWLSELGGSDRLPSALRLPSQRSSSWVRMQ